MINPELLYKLYMSLKVHFTHKTYNVIEYNGGIKLKPLEERKDRPLFYYASKKFDDKRHAVNYLIANFSRGHMYPFTEDGKEKGDRNYKEWLKIKESLTKHFKDDLSYLEFNGVCYNNIDQLYELTLKRKITIETIAILDAYSNILESDKIKNSVWANELLHIRKYKYLLNTNKDSLKAAFDEFKSHETV